MFDKASAFRSALLVACFTLSSIQPAQAGFSDRLETPAIQTPEATRSLLLDIETAGQRLVAVGEQGAILLSDNGGDSWNQAPAPVSVLLTAAHFPTSDTGWVVGHDGVVLRTNDGGQNWQAVLSAIDLNQLRVDQLEQTVAEADERGDMDEEQYETLTYALDDALIAQEESAMTPLLDVWFASESEGFLLGAYGQLYRTQDGGQNWQSLGHRLPNPDGFHLNKMAQHSDGSYYIAGEAGIVMRSADRGETWELIDSPYDGSFFSVIQHQELYLMGLRGNIFRSDNTVDWEKVELPKQATLNAAVSDGEHLFLLGQGGLLLKNSERGFKVFSRKLNRTLVAGVISNGQLITVGSGGINRLSLDAEE